MWRAVGVRRVVRLYPEEAWGAIRASTNERVPELMEEAQCMHVCEMGSYLRKEWGEVVAVYNGMWGDCRHTHGCAASTPCACP